MKLVRMVRDTPTKGGAKVLNVPESDVDKLKYQGWVVAESSAADKSSEAETVEHEEPKTEETNSLKSDTGSEVKTDTPKSGRSGRKPRDE